MRLACALLLLSCTYTIGYGCNSNPFFTNAGPLVRTLSGPLIGKYVLGNNVAAFLGIPYALPPVNEKRFMKPCPFHHWEGILNATNKPKPCMQYSSRNFSWIPTSTPSEDCLYLNVWAPTCISGESMAVLVFIYGGGFYSGSSDLDVYDGSILASQNNAIIVSMNYRVGIFGFLKTSTEEAPGNVGLLDQNLALKWIKDNIQYFGGDPNRITIMGQSAGSWSVSLHMVSPMSQNLFNSAILQSGTAYHPQLVDSPKVAYEKANTFAKVIGCLSNNSSIEYDPEILQCIQSKSSKELAKFEDMFTSKMPFYFLPTYGDEFLPSSLIKAVNEGRVTPVNALIGNTQNEATIFLNYLLPDIFKLDTEPELNLNLAQTVIAGLFSTVPQPSANEIFQYYFQNISNADSKELTKIIGNAFGDFVFNCPTQFFAEKLANAYFYWITHRSSNEMKAEWLGVAHFSEIPFLFGEPLRGTPGYTPEDSIFSADIMKKWVTFAQFGHPLADSFPEKWPPFTENHVVYELSPKHEDILSFPRSDACEFWRPYLEIIPSSKDC